jgi:aryl-alcohol dehydrogenase-like predicted oxidoreductase
MRIITFCHRPFFTIRQITRRQNPEGARVTLWPDYTRYSNPAAVAATEAYVSLARNHSLDPAQMALAYVNSRPFLTSTIIGATTMKQLRSNVDSIKMTLSDEVLSSIEEIHNNHANPSP